jgi:hypothetical protein
VADDIHLAAIRARDAQSAETWFRTTPKEPDGVGACGRAFIDRRWLLAELDREVEKNDKLRDEAFRLRQRLADLHSAATETT